MKAIILYASTHHGNTKKIVDAIANEYDIDTLDATAVNEKDLSGYDLIGIASGIYAGSFHQAVRTFVRKNLPVNKKIFFVSTNAMNKDFSASMKDALKDKDAQILGSFSCFGYNTFGPFKLIGGTAKGHPDEDDIRNALAFYRRIGSTCSKMQDII